MANKSSWQIDGETWGNKSSWQIDGETWQVDGETMETVRDFIFGGSKITADGDCSHEIQRRLLLARKSIQI